MSDTTGVARQVTLSVLALTAAIELVAIFTANSLLEQLIKRLDQSTRRYWDAVADSAAANFEGAGREVEPALTQQRLNDFARDYNVATLKLHTRGGPTLTNNRPAAGDLVLTRPMSSGRIELAFDTGPAALQRGTARLLISTNRAVMYATLVFLIGYTLYMFFAAYSAARPADDRERSTIFDPFRVALSNLYQRESQLKREHVIERKRAADLERVAATLTRSLGSGFIALDATGSLLELNVAAREILRLPTDLDFRGRRIDEVIVPGEFTEIVLNSIRNRVNLNRKEVVYRHAESELLLGLTTATLISEDEVSMGLIVLFTDLSSIRSLQDRVRQLQTLADLGQVSAGIAHEFRNSLSTVIGYVRLARRSPELGRDAGLKLEHAEAEARQLTEAVERLLTFGRPVTLARERFDLAEVVQSVTERVTSGDERGAQIEFAVQPAQVDGDPILFGIVVENIIRNALDAVEANEEKRIHISLQAHPRPTFVVSDNGIGLDPADAPRLFLPFQSDKTTGFGIGLALARKIVLLHDGDISLTGVPGKGATVTVQLPAVQSDGTGRYIS